MRLPANIRFTLIFVLPFLIATYLLVNNFAPQKFVDTETEVNYWRKKGDLFRSSLASLEPLKKEKGDIYLHYNFLETYCLLKLRERDLIKKDVDEVFGNLESYYHELLLDSPNNPIGFYGYWKLKTYLDIEHKETLHFDKSDSIDFKAPFINELRGDIYQGSEEAIKFYEIEMDSFPNNRPAKIKLFRILIYSKKSERLEKLLNDEMILSEPSLFSIIRFHYFKTDFYKWISIIPRQFVSFSNYTVILNALFIFIVWLAFLFYIDVFKDIKKGILLVAAIFSVISIPFVITFYDAYYFTRDASYEGNIFWDNFLVGLFEETAKIIFPLLIAIFFTSRLKSPFSVMILFSVSALIFATLENMNYFENYFDITITSARSVYSVLGHLTDITVAAYGYILYEFRNRSIFYFLLTFILAILMHMLYDVISESFIHYILVPFVVVSAFIIVSIYNNLLNNSPNFNHEKEAKLNKSGFVLIAGLSLVIVMEYISVSFKYGVDIGNTTLLDSGLSYGWLILIFASPVSNFKLVKEKWSFIDFGGLKTFDSHSNEILEINVKPIAANSQSYRLEIIGTIRANSEKKWFHCYQQETNEYYLVCFKEDGDQLVDKNILLFVLQAEKNVPHAFNPKSYKYLGMVHSNPVIND